LFTKGLHDGVDELGCPPRVGLGRGSQQPGIPGGGHALGAAVGLEQGEDLFGGQSWSDYAFQGRVNLGEQPADSVRQAGRFTGEVVVEPDQYLQLGQRLLAGVDSAQGVWQRSGGVGDHIGVAGVGLRGARVEVGDPAHRESGQVSDLDTHRPGDRDRQRADRVRLVHDHEHPAMALELGEQVLEPVLVLRQGRVEQTLPGRVERARVVVLLADVQPAPHREGRLGFLTHRWPSFRSDGHRSSVSRRHPRYEETYQHAAALSLSAVSQRPPGPATTPPGS